MLKTSTLFMYNNNSLFFFKWIDMLWYSKFSRSKCKSVKKEVVWWRIQKSNRKQKELSMQSAGNKIEYKRCLA